MNDRERTGTTLEELWAEIISDDSAPSQATKATKSPKIGVIYFIRRVNSMRWVKIGWTGNLEDRLKTLQTASPETLFVHAFEPNKTKSDERAIHKLFEGCRRSGEWFYVKGPVLDYLHERYGWNICVGQKPESARHQAKRLEEERAAELAELIRLTAEGEEEYRRKHTDPVKE